MSAPRDDIFEAARHSGWSLKMTGVVRDVYFKRGRQDVSVSYTPDGGGIVSAFDGTTAIKGKDMTAAVVEVLRGS